MARLTFPSRLELKSLAGSFKEAPLKKVSFTIDLYDSPGADAAVMGPYRGPHPLPLFHDIRVGLLDERAHAGQRIAPPVAQRGDLPVDQLGGGLAFGFGLVRRSLVPFRT